MNLTSASRSARAVVVLIVLATLPGCYPKNVVWLTDSSGIIFTANKDSRLVLYNLARNSRKVLVDDSKTETPWPAISADGKRVALARVESSAEIGSKIDTHRIEVIIYDIRGQELKRSRPLITTSESDKPNTAAASWLSGAFLNWSGPAEKILLNTHMCDAIYDCVRDEWTKLDVAILPFNNTPIRPDGRGFLASTKKTIVFVDWDGWVTEFAWEITEKMDILAFEWDDKIARFTMADGVLELDTQGMRATFKMQAPRLLKGDGKPVWIHRFRDGAAQICVFERKIGDSTRHRVEVQIPDTMKRRTILREGELDRVLLPWFFPSPDGKKVAFYITTTKHEATIIVVNDSGTIDARIIP